MCHWGQSEFESETLVLIGTIDRLSGTVNASRFFCSSLNHLSILDDSRLPIVCSLSPSFATQWPRQRFPDWVF